MSILENKRMNGAYWTPFTQFKNYNEFSLSPDSFASRIAINFIDLMFLIISSVFFALFQAVFLLCIAVPMRAAFYKYIHPDSLFDRYLEGVFYNPSTMVYRFLEGKHFSRHVKPEMDLEIGIYNGQASDLHFPDVKFKVGTEYSKLWKEDDLIVDKYRWKYKVACDMRNLPFKSDCFYNIASVHVIDHINDYRDAIREVARVLKPGGSFILSTYSVYYLTLNLHSLCHYIKGDFQKAVQVGEDKQKIHFNFYTQEEWRENLKEFGMDLTEFRSFINGPVKYLWYLLHRYPIQSNGFLPFQYWMHYQLPGAGLVKSFWAWINYSIFYPAVIFDDRYDRGINIFMKIVKKGLQ